MSEYNKLSLQLAAMSQAEFGRVMQSALPKDRKALLRARLRHHIGEFAEMIVSRIISRSAKWSPLTDFHRAIYALYETPFEQRTGLDLDLLLAPRGAAKTTSAKIKVLHSILYKTEVGVAVIAAAHHEAASWLSTLATWAGEPEVEYLFGPIAVEGTQTDLSINGIPLWARGWSSSIRGLNRDGIRPSLVILDDIESERTTRSEYSRDDTVERLSGVIAPLGPTEGGLVAIWLATPCHHDAAAARVLRGEGGLAAWQAHRYPAVTRWPTDPIWDAVKATYLDVSTGLEPDARWNKALTLLDNHPEAYENAITIDPTRLPIQECFRRRWDVGELSWAREYDVLPNAPGSTLFNTSSWPRFRLDGPTIVTDKGIPIAWKAHLKLSLAYDPSEGGDDGALCLMGKEASGRCYILDSETMGIHASSQIPRLVAMAKKWGMREAIVEMNQFPSLLKDAIEKECKAVGISLNIIECRQTRNKENRLSALEAPASNGLIAVRSDMPNNHLRLVDNFNPGRKDNRDDLLDAIEMAYSNLNASPITFGSRPL